MRIVSGTHKGRVIHPPATFKARPTTDFAKENLFNVLNNTWDFEGVRVLDLFSGSGSISFEFASRGASYVLSVEIDHSNQQFISKTIEKLGFSEVIKSVHQSVFDLLRRYKTTGVDKGFDFIFADPPYDMENLAELPDLILSTQGLLNPEGWLIVEHSSVHNFEQHPYFLETRRWGSVNFSIFSKEGS